MSALFDTLCARLHAEPDSRGEVWIACPSCGKDHKHFSFNEKYGGHCFACDFSGSLAQISELLRIQPDERVRPARRAQKPLAPRVWQQRPDFYLDRYCDALDRVTAWQAYKPLSLDSIARFRLGVGQLPASRCEIRRLIVPVFDGGRCVALHGRAYLPEDTDAKWLSAGGSSKQVLFNAGALTPGATVVIVENFVDAILAMQVEPSIVAVCGGGVSWQDAWTQQIAASLPRQVLVWLDNDAAGGPNAETWRAFCAAWKQQHPDREPPAPRGPQIANDLLAAGVRARCYAWPCGTPAKQDIGAALMREGAAV